MELKSEQMSTSSESRTGSNRTFMELKFSESDCTERGLSSSNRTFMELKFSIGLPSLQ